MLSSEQNARVKWSKTEDNLHLLLHMQPIIKNRMTIIKINANSNNFLL